MKRSTALLRCMFFALVSTMAAAHAQPAVPSERIIRHLSYGPHAERNLLDLYLPAVRGPAPLPVIVWLHSGG